MASVAVSLSSVRTLLQLRTWKIGNRWKKKEKKKNCFLFDAWWRHRKITSFPAIIRRWLGYVFVLVVAVFWKVFVILFFFFSLFFLFFRWQKKIWKSFELPNRIWRNVSKNACIVARYILADLNNNVWIFQWVMWKLKMSIYCFFVIVIEIWGKLNRLNLYYK